MSRGMLVVVAALFIACSSTPEEETQVAECDVVVFEETIFPLADGTEGEVKPGLYNVARAGDATLRLTGEEETHLLRAAPVEVKEAIGETRAFYGAASEEEDAAKRLVWLSTEGSLQVVGHSGGVRARGLIGPFRLPFPPPLPKLTVDVPGGSTRWRAGTTQTIRWSTSGSVGTLVYLSLFRVTSSGGLSWAGSIASRIYNSGSRSWAIPAGLSEGQYHVYICNYVGSVRDYSDRFTISAQAKLTEIGNWSPKAISADGRFLVGKKGNEAARYEIATGSFTMLGDLEGGPVGSEATAVSADGSVVAGLSWTEKAGVGTFQQGFRWTAATGLQMLGRKGHCRWVNGISDDGSVVVGAFMETKSICNDPYCDDPQHWTHHAYRWPTDNPDSYFEQTLGAPPGADLDRETMALAVSADGNTLLCSYGGTFYRWTEAGSWVQLSSGSPAAMTMIGSEIIVVGHGLVSGALRPLRWSSADGSRLTLDDTDDRAVGVSGDGSRVVLRAKPGSRGGSLWTEGTGARPIAEVITANAGSVSGWTDLTPGAISRDGRMIVGTGTKDGAFRVFVLTLPATLD